MKIRNFLTLLALLISPVLGHTSAEPEKTQVQKVASSPAPAPAEANDLLDRLKGRVDPNYVARLQDVPDHGHGPRT